jgi:alkanesulfonate monooxygenase SsuD/methylene tetrahydromethanopterin reductase-like flavin-dependent oxidoreductase (luciferase family)
MVGGSGEKKTLRFVAKYADACNIFAIQGPDFVRQRLGVLREHCDREGRDWNDIEKTAYVILNVGPNGELTGALVEQLGVLAEMGVQTAIGGMPQVQTLTPIEIVGRDVIPQVRGL